MKEIIRDIIADVIVGASMVIAMAAMLGYAVTAYREILFNVIKAWYWTGRINERYY